MGKRSAVVELFLGDMGSIQRELRPSTQREDQLTMETKLEQIAVKAVNQLPKSVVREIRMPRSVGAGGGRPPPATRWMWKRSYGRTTKAPPDERGGKQICSNLTPPRHISTLPITSYYEFAGHFRSSPINGHSQSPSACLKGANNRHQPGRAPPKSVWHYRLIRRIVCCRLDYGPMVQERPVRVVRAFFLSCTNASYMS